MIIPPSTQPKLAALLSFDEAVFSQIEQAIKGARVGSSAADLTSLVVKNVTGPGDDELRSAMSAAFEVYRVSAHRSVPAEQFIPDLFEAARDARTERLKEAAADEQAFSNRIRRVLSLGPSFAVAAKASGLRDSHERTYCHSRVLTDIRPIFRESATDPPVGGIVTHALLIGYHGDDGAVRTFFVNLSDMDVTGLMANLERAKVKGRTVATLLTKAGLTNVGSDAEVSGE